MVKIFTIDKQSFDHLPEGAPVVERVPADVERSAGRAPARGCPGQRPARSRLRSAMARRGSRDGTICSGSTIDAARWQPATADLAQDVSMCAPPTATTFHGSCAPTPAASLSEASAFWMPRPSRVRPAPSRTPRRRLPTATRPDLHNHPTPASPQNHSLDAPLPFPARIKCVGARARAAPPRPALDRRARLLSERQAMLSRSDCPESMRCASCGRDFLSGARFCDARGTALPPGPAADAASLKIVMVVFADSIGSTSLQLSTSTRSRCAADGTGTTPRSTRQSWGTAGPL